jgi:hypothetical protein
MSTPAATQRQGDLRNYAVVTGAYWADTIADGAIRVLVLFYFYELGYSPLAVASLFLFYEIFGIVTNLFGGFLAARFGLKSTLLGGLTTQIAALAMLALVPESWLVVAYVMVAQALSGIAKDLTKMSSKSAVKLVVPEGQEGALYTWVAVLTGSKNALKGVGFFVGGLLLSTVGFQTALLILAGLVSAALLGTLALMRGDLGTPNAKARFSQMFSHTRAVNVLAGARIFLFASRDVWFVVGVPVFLRTELGWTFWQVGTFLAVWVIGYGIVQASAPRLIRGRGAGGARPRLAGFLLAAFPAGIASRSPPTSTRRSCSSAGSSCSASSSRELAVHSFLILAYADGDKVAMNVGFYYMANAGRAPGGTVLSGALYQWQGLEACLWASVVFVLAAGSCRARCAGTRRGRAARAGWPSGRRLSSMPSRMCATVSHASTAPRRSRRCPSSG